jgi:hypothetical protein
MFLLTSEMKENLKILCVTISVVIGTSSIVGDPPLDLCIVISLDINVPLNEFSITVDDVGCVCVCACACACACDCDCDCDCACVVCFGWLMGRGLTYGGGAGVKTVSHLVNTYIIVNVIPEEYKNRSMYTLDALQTRDVAFLTKLLHTHTKEGFQSSV